MSDIEGKATRVAARELGSDRVSNDEAPATAGKLLTNDEGSANVQMTKGRSAASSRRSDLDIPSTSGVRHSSLSKGLIATASQLSELLKRIEPAERIAVDTEADSLHCYREKLCLLQISVPGWIERSALDANLGAEGALTNIAPATAGKLWSSRSTCDFIVDPLADIDLAPLRAALEPKELVLQGADFDLRMLRRGLNFTARKVFDTVIAARLLGIREFSLAALVKKYFDVDLPKGSQKANWAQRPLPARMAEYATNDTHYLLPLAEKLEAELDRHRRLEWFRQSCQRAIEQAAIKRERDEDDAWRIRGSGALRGRAAPVVRALWQWREKEAEAADRPPFHILQNQELLNAAESFAAGKVPDYRHFSDRRRQAFRHAAERALQLPEDRWPVSRRRFGTRPTAETVRRTEELRQKRDHAAKDLKLEPAFVAARAALEAIATDPKHADTLLVPWQRQLLGL